MTLDSASPPGRSETNLCRSLGPDAEDDPRVVQRMRTSARSRRRSDHHVRVARGLGEGSAMNVLRLEVRKDDLARANRAEVRDTLPTERLSG
jgi:hypothetical protein